MKITEVVSLTEIERNILNDLKAKAAEVTPQHVLAYDESGNSLSVSVQQIEARSAPELFSGKDEFIFVISVTDNIESSINLTRGWTMIRIENLLRKLSEIIFEKLDYQ